MSRKLAQLIAAYEAECSTLAALLAECLAENDYKYANLFQKGLFRVNQQLHTLRCLQDEHHGDKENAEQYIHNLQRLLAGKELAEPREYREYLTAKLADAQARLAALQQLPPKPQVAGRVVRDLLMKLLASELSGFVLVLKPAEQLHCHLRLVRKTLLLTIPELHRHTATRTLEKQHVHQLKRLGFQPYDHGDKLMLFAPFTTAEDVLAMQQLLARLVFEGLDLGELGAQMQVRYW